MALFDALLQWGEAAVDFADEVIRNVMDVGDDLVESFSIDNSEVPPNISPSESARRKVLHYNTLEVTATTVVFYSHAWVLLVTDLCVFCNLLYFLPVSQSRHG